MPRLFDRTCSPKERKEETTNLALRGVLETPFAHHQKLVDFPFWLLPRLGSGVQRLVQGTGTSLRGSTS